MKQLLTVAVVALALIAGLLHAGPGTAAPKKHKCPGKLTVKNERYADRIKAKGVSCRKARRIVRAYHAGSGPNRKRWYCAVVGPWPDYEDPVGNAWFCVKQKSERVTVNWISVWD